MIPTHETRAARKVFWLSSSNTRQQKEFSKIIVISSALAELLRSNHTGLIAVKKRDKDTRIHTYVCTTTKENSFWPNEMSYLFTTAVSKGHHVVAKTITLTVPCSRCFLLGPVFKKPGRPVGKYPPFLKSGQLNIKTKRVVI